MRGRRRRLVNAEHLLARPPVRWKSTVALGADACRQRAEKLRDALAQALARQHELAGPHLMQLASTLYRQHFGSEIDEDNLRYAMDPRHKAATTALTSGNVRNYTLRTWTRL